MTVHPLVPEAHGDALSHLMGRISRGDVPALRALLECTWSGLVTYCAGMIGSRDEAEDIVQEVFVRVWEHRARWTPGGSVRGYLFRIARNLVLLQLDHQRVRARSAPELRRGQPAPCTPHQHAVANEFEDALMEALGDLPPRRREAFTLVRLQGLSLGEASEVMGATRRTVANHVYMAARELEENLRPFLS